MPAPAKRVLITGASRGIGQAIAACFASHHWQVFSPTRAQLDLAQLDSVKAFVQSGGCDVDVLINNAGENIVMPFEKLSLPDWMHMQSVNLTAPFLLCQAATQTMLSNGWGRIVNVASCYSLVSRAGRAGYTASKSGLAGLTRAIAVEFAERGILANCVSPGFIETEMTQRNNTATQLDALRGQLPVKRLGTPAEIANLVYYLGSEQNTYSTGQNIAADGGFLCT